MTVEGSQAYADVADLPPLVRAAVALAESQDFGHSCAPQQGRLLAVIAAGRAGQRVGETGTGCGVGLAWMVSAAGPGTEFVSIEVDPVRAAAAADLFGDYPNVRVLHGDWTGLREHGPFDLLVLDGGGKGKDPIDPPLDPAEGWLAVGGTIVLDDFTPLAHPNAAEHDVGRRHWLEHPLLRSTEIRLSPTLATIVGLRTR